MVLGRLRRALADRPGPVAVPRVYRTGGDLDLPARLDLLVDRLVDYKAAVRRCTAAELPAVLATALTDRATILGREPGADRAAGRADGAAWGPAAGRAGGGRPGPVAGAVRVVVPPGLPWTVPGGVPDDGLTAAELDALDGVVTACAVAVAETGTIVLDASPDQGRRAITLVPDWHLCVVRADQVVQTVPEAVARLDPTRPLTWISGPSATSDIELHRVEGVHGPRTLEVVLVS